MVSIVSLWLPILVSGVLVFLASFVIHMVLPYHRGDFKKLPAEDAVADALRAQNIAPGEYMLPCGSGPASMRDPAFIDKMARGPVAILTFMKPGKPNMGPQLLQWFVYCLVVGVLAAYVAGRALAPGARYLEAFRFAGPAAFIGYAVALWQDSIWYKRPWGTTLRNTFDGLVYGMLTAGAFGWLWPR